MKALDSQQSSPQKNQGLETQQVTGTQDAKPERSWDWIWQAIGIVLIIKFFGPAGGVTAGLVYIWQRPRIGKWPAAALSVVVGIAVPLLILAMI